MPDKGSSDESMLAINESSTPPPASGPRHASETAEQRVRTKKPLDLLELGADTLTPVEKFQIGFIRKTFESQPVNRTIRTLQRVVGSTWVEYGVRNLRRVYGSERLPQLPTDASAIIVSNHRSFFDLYVITGYLMRYSGLRQRIMFPVRSKFFYDSMTGFALNGLMSFFAMYPPVFRERSRASLNVATLDETARMLRFGGTMVGLHPEGQRNKSDDPYALLPAQRGVGRIIHDSRVPVIPAFINGLSNDFPKQVAGNFTKSGAPVIVVFGKPVDFGGMLDEASSPKLHARIAEQALGAVKTLGEEERAIRATLS